MHSEALSESKVYPQQDMIPETKVVAVYRLVLRRQDRMIADEDGIARLSFVSASHRVDFSVEVMSCAE